MVWSVGRQCLFRYRIKFWWWHIEWRPKLRKTYNKNGRNDRHNCRFGVNSLTSICIKVSLVTDIVGMSKFNIYVKRVCSVSNNHCVDDKFAARILLFFFLRWRLFKSNCNWGLKFCETLEDPHEINPCSEFIRTFHSLTMQKNAIFCGNNWWLWLRAAKKFF